MAGQELSSRSSDVGERHFPRSYSQATKWNVSLPWKQIGNFSGFEHCNKNLGSFKANVFNWWPFNILILAFSVLLYIWSFFFNCEKLFTSCLTHLNPQHCRSDLGDVRMTAWLRKITKVWLFFGHVKCGSDVSLKGGSVSLLMWGKFLDITVGEKEESGREPCWTPPVYRNGKQ